MNRETLGAIVTALACLLILLGVIGWASAEPVRTVTVNGVTCEQETPTSPWRC